MCRSKDQNGRRCAAHSPENRAAERAAVRLDETFEDYLEALEAKTAELKREVAGGEPAAIEAAVAAWLAAWRDLMSAMAKAYARLEAKAERAAAVRRERTQERLDAVLDAERHAMAARAIKANEDAVAALRLAEQKRRDLELMVALAEAAEAFGTQHELVRRALDEAEVQLTLAHAETERLRGLVKPSDEIPVATGPRRGLPGLTVTAFHEARRREEFWASQHIRLTTKLRETPSREATRRMLSAVTEACEAGRQYVASTRSARDAALALGRPRKAVDEPAEVRLVAA
ncbi:hypothetical protein [Specibacter sp. RAF43]|uniref:hypothetical protein n=1 Tax=Specibacter sp. RAF43 TaxID=3233057 RepID=UPI003F9A431C